MLGQFHNSSGNANIADIGNIKMSSSMESTKQNYENQCLKITFLNYAEVWSQLDQMQLNIYYYFLNGFQMKSFPGHTPA